MAFIHGKAAAVTVNGTALGAYGNNINLKIGIDTADVSTFGNTWKANVVGMAGATVTIDGDYDPVVTVGPQAVLQALIGAAAFPVLYFPGGNTTGQVKHTFNAILTDYSESSSTGDAVKWSASVILTGADTITLVP